MGGGQTVVIAKSKRTERHDKFNGSDESDSHSYSYTVFIRPDDSLEPTSAPTQPFALNVESGKAVYLGMSRDAAETVAGAPVAAGWGTRMEYEGLEIGYPGEAPKDYATTLTLYLGSGGVNGIILRERQYGLTGQ